MPRKTRWLIKLIFVLAYFVGFCLFVCFNLVQPLIILTDWFKDWLIDQVILFSCLFVCLRDFYFVGFIRSSCFASFLFCFRIIISTNGKSIVSFLRITYFLQAACVAVAALLQYFLMAFFCWMLVVGIYIYLFLVKVYSITDKMYYYHGSCWGGKHSQ